MTVHYPSDESALEFQNILAKHNVLYDSKGVGGFSWTSVIASFLPILLLIGFWIFLMNQMQGGGSKVMSFGKSRAKRMAPDSPKIGFKDVAGVDEAVEELQEIKEFLENPKKFQALGARIPKGVLLYGPPGTGKTLLARAVAGEAGVPFFSISGSDFVEMFVGVGASRVRDLFEQAKQASPCIVFIDEIDAVGRHRGAGLGGGHDEREQTLNQLLVEMDGFEMKDNIILIAATNRPDVLDPALLRPGRFDRQIVVDRPDRNGRRKILEVHSKGKPLDTEIDLDSLAGGTPGFTGADLANLVNEAALLAARHGKKTIGQEDLEEGIMRVIAGPEKKARLALGEGAADHRLPRDGPCARRALPREHEPDPQDHDRLARPGARLTISLPTEDRYMQTKQALQEEIAMTLGGRAAEELVFNEVTTGAANDIEKVTHTAKQMVMRYGMSEKLGPRVLGRNTDMPFLGREMGHEPDYSDELAREIDDEVRRIIEDGHELALRVLREHLEELHRISQVLIERETIDKDQFVRLIAGESEDDVFAVPEPPVLPPPPARARPAPGDQATPVPAAGVGDAAAGARRRELDRSMQLDERGAGRPRAGPAPRRQPIEPRFPRPSVVGVVNVTPDSFSDGGVHLAPSHAIACRAHNDRGRRRDRRRRRGVDPAGSGGRLRGRGARPRRAGARGARGRAASRSTRRRPQVARAAIELGAELVNDVTRASRRPGARRGRRRRGRLPVPHAHARRAGDDAGRPALRRRRQRGQGVPRAAPRVRGRPGGARGAGLPRSRASASARPSEHNFELIRRLDELVALGRPVMIGFSRKSSLGRILGDPAATTGTMAASLGVAVAAFERGASLIRAHDVREHVEALRVAGGGESDEGRAARSRAVRLPRRRRGRAGARPAFRLRRRARGRRARDRRPDRERGRLPRGRRLPAGGGGRPSSGCSRRWPAAIADALARALRRRAGQGARPQARGLPGRGDARVQRGHRRTIRALDGRVTRAFVGIGANLGDRERTIRSAAELIGAQSPLEPARDRAVGARRPAAVPQRRRRARDRARRARAARAAARGRACSSAGFATALAGAHARSTSTCSSSARESIDEPGLTDPPPPSARAGVRARAARRARPALEVPGRGQRLGAPRGATIPPVSHLDELDEFEAELELRLKREYGAVYSLFRYCVLTSDGTYLCNKLDMQYVPQPSYPFFQLKMEDVWVWDKSRPTRMIPRVELWTSGDVTVEELRSRRRGAGAHRRGARQADERPRPRRRRLSAPAGGADRCCSRSTPATRRRSSASSRAESSSSSSVSRPTRRRRRTSSRCCCARSST